VDRGVVAVIPHLALPLRLNGRGSAVTVEQDSPEEIAQCVAVVLATPVGSRVEVPDFGSPRADFDEQPDTAGMVAAVEEWEPRADLDVTAVEGLGLSGTVTEIAAEVAPHV
jgi:phage baseplate assembly protein W